jgi:hypothetical protein
MFLYITGVKLIVVTAVTTRFQIDNETLIQDMTEIKIITELKFSLEIAE